MSRSICVLVAAALSIVSQAVPATAVVGDLTLGGGGFWPQQDMAYYSDPGPHFFGRIDFQLPDAPVLMFWTGVGGTFFAEDKQRVFIPTTGDPIPADQTTTQTALTFHIGAQLGSPSRRGFFRPRVAAGVGLYSLQTDTDWKWTNEDEAFSSLDEDSQVRLGWRGILGADFFFSPKWGLGAEFVSDQIWNVDQEAGEDAEKVTASYQGFSICVVLPLEIFKGRSGN